ncbi:MAG: ABC transporter permease [Solobacterium sp.]|nr:ABC transporter permease [Solobacterium sp.]
MRKSLSLKLAAHNLKSSYRLSVPYILSGILSYAMCYIVLALASDEGLGNSFGGNASTQMLGMGSFIVAIGAFLFLFNISRYLVNQRGREFALYGILGMDKLHVMKVLLIESLITFVIVSLGGLVSGLVFGKLMQLVLLRMMHYSGNIAMHFSVVGLAGSTALFALIYVVNFLFASLKIAVSSPVTLLQSRSVGEKQIRISPLITVAGILAVGTGYVIAQFPTDVADATGIFLPAVLLVIVGTHCLFLTGTAAVMNLLKKNKKFYYQPHHFISLSGMMHRMKRNASGLATVCILSCMTIVSISATVAVYYGTNETISDIPREIMLSGSLDSRDDYILVEEFVRKTAAQYDPKDFTGIVVSHVNYRKEGSGFVTDLNNDGDVYIEFAEAGAEGLPDVTVSAGEVWLFAENAEQYGDTLTLNGKEYHISGRSAADKENMSARTYMTAVISDFDQIDWEVNKPSWISYDLAFDVGTTDLTEIQEILESCCKAVNDAGRSRGEGSSFYAYGYSRRGTEAEAYGAYGSLLFLGIFLGTMFLIMTVLIIYYKQMSEGFEDVNRFRQMENVGLEETEVRKTIRSQVLTTFFLPLITALVHVVFAHNLVGKIVEGFDTVNQYAYTISLGVTSLIFTVIYMIVYWGTSRVYYHIIRQA